MSLIAPHFAVQSVSQIAKSWPDIKLDFGSDTHSGSPKFHEIFARYQADHAKTTDSITPTKDYLDTLS